MKNTFFIPISFFVFMGCNPAPDGLTQTTQSAAQITASAAAQQAEKDPNLISSSVKMVKDYKDVLFSKQTYKKDAEFEAFFKQFCADTLFCNSRTILPYKEIIFAIENDKGETEITTNLYKKFPYHFNEVGTKNDGYRFKIESLRNDTASVLLTLGETGIMIETIFVKRNNQWFALETNDFST